MIEPYNIVMTSNAPLESPNFALDAWNTWNTSCVHELCCYWLHKWKIKYSEYEAHTISIVKKHKNVFSDALLVGYWLCKLVLYVYGAVVGVSSRKSSIQENINEFESDQHNSSRELEAEAYPPTSLIGTHISGLMLDSICILFPHGQTEVCCYRVRSCSVLTGWYWCTSALFFPPWYEQTHIGSHTKHSCRGPPGLFR